MRASRIVVTLCVLTAAALTSAEAFAGAPVAWKAAVNGNWSDGTKWSTNAPPQMGDDVIIAVDGTYTVTVDVDPVLNSLSLGGSTGTQRLNVGNRLLTLNGPNPSTVGAHGVLGAGSLAGSGNLTINGTLDWGNGSIGGAGALTVNGGLLFSSPSSKTLNGRTLVLNGSAQWTGSGTVSLSNGAVLHNTASGTVDFQVGGFMGISGAPTTELFDNDGALLKSAGGGMTIDVPIDSSTGVTVNAGTLIASRGGTWTGPLTAAAGTILRFNGGTHSLSGVTIGGAGRTEISGGIVNATGAVSVDAMATLAQSATLGGSGTVTVDGMLEWNAGTITGTGMVVVNGLLTFNTASSKVLNGRTLLTNGTTQWKSGGAVNLSGGALLHNAAAGMFDMQATAFMGISGSPTTERFDNDGTLMKTSGGTTTLDVPVDTSTGLSVNNGVLVASRGGTWSGQLNVAAASTLRFNGGTHSLTGVTIAGPGRAEVSGGVVNTTGAVAVAASATLAVTATLGGGGPLSVDGTLEWTAGTITGAGMCAVNGMFILDTASSKNLSGRTLDVNGVAQWKGIGAFNLSNGAVVHNAASGTFDMQGNAFMGIGGSPTTERFDNDGALMKSGMGGTTTIDVPIDTSTGLSINDGLLVASRGGTWTGPLSIAMGSTLRFNGGTHSLSGVAITGPGRAEVSGGVVNTTGAVGVAPMTTLAVAATLGGGGPLMVDGTLEWTAGSIIGAGMCVVNGLLTIEGLASKTLSGRTVDVNGTAQWKSNGSLNLANAAVLHNAPSGSFDIQGDAFMGVSGSPSTELFDNDGVLMKSGAAGMTTFDVAVTNSGTVAINSGSIAFTRAAYLQTAGSTTLNGGNMSAQVGVGMNMQGGSLRGSGTVTGHVSNGGTVAPGLSPGKITITGNYTQTAAGTLAVEIGGTAPATGFDQLQVNGTATLGGTLNVTLINGFVPVDGNQFVVLSGTTTGNFTATNLPPLPGGLMWQVTSGSVTLTVGSGGPTATVTATVPSTSTGTSTATRTPTSSPTASRTATPVVTLTGVASATATLTRTPTPTSTATNTATPIGTASVTPSGDATPTPTLSSSRTHTATSTATNTTTATPPNARTATATRSNTATSTVAATPPNTPTSSATGAQPDTPTPTITGGPGEFIFTGTLLAPGPFGTGGNGLVAIPFVDVDLQPPCEKPSTCLRSLAVPIATVQTDEQGRFMFRLSRDIVRQRRYVLFKATFQGVFCRLLITPTRLAQLAAAQDLAIAGINPDDFRIDPIIEAASRLLEDAGADNFGDDGIAAVIAAVVAANADTQFDGLDVPAANDLAETTAANDPDVQMVIARSQLTPTPTVTPITCIGDCNHDGMVVINELITGVNIALNRLPSSACPPFDRDGSQTVTINELIAAVNAALFSCP